jgi:hypothetical protein
MNTAAAETDNLPHFTAKGAEATITKNVPVFDYKDLATKKNVDLLYMGLETPGLGMILVKNHGIFPYSCNNTEEQQVEKFLKQFVSTIITRAIRQQPKFFTGRVRHEITKVSACERSVISAIVVNDEIKTKGLYRIDGEKRIHFHVEEPNLLLICCGDILKTISNEKYIQGQCEIGQDNIPHRISYYEVFKTFDKSILSIFK